MWEVMPKFKEWLNITQYVVEGNKLIESEIYKKFEDLTEFLKWKEYNEQLENELKQKYWNFIDFTWNEYDDSNKIILIDWPDKIEIDALKLILKEREKPITEEDNRRIDSFLKTLENSDWKDIKWDIIKSISNLDNPLIDKRKLKIFLEVFLLQSWENNIFSNILNNRWLDYDNLNKQQLTKDEKANQEIIITKLLISSFKSEINKLNIRSWDPLYFNELEIRKEIFWEEVAQFEKKWMSNVDGKITNLSFFLIDSENGKDLFFDSSILDFVKAKSNDELCKVNILYNDLNAVRKLLSKVSQSDRNLIEKKVNFILAKDIGTSVWCIRMRDAAVSMQDWTICESNSSYQYSLTEQYDNLAPKMWSDIIQSDLVFQWWNMRQTEKYLFIGYDDIMATIKKENWSKRLDSTMKPRKPIPWNQEEYNKRITETIEKFKKNFGKEVVVLWLEKDIQWNYEEINNKQSPFHIDLIMTPIDDNNVLVWYQDDFNKDISAQKIVNQLNRLWITAHKIPQFWQYTYNNVLIESYIEDWQMKKVVYIPKYYKGSSELIKSEEINSEEINSETFVYIKDLNNFYDKMNSAAKESYEKLWFEVHQISISEEVLNKKWALNCITFESRAKI